MRSLNILIKLDKPMIYLETVKGVWKLKRVDEMIRAIWIMQIFKSFMWTTTTEPKAFHKSFYLFCI